jgi:hypothetical protein
MKRQMPSLSTTEQGMVTFLAPATTGAQPVRQTDLTEADQAELPGALGWHVAGKLLIGRLLMAPD